MKTVRFVLKTEKYVPWHTTVYFLRSAGYYRNDVWFQAGRLVWPDEKEKEGSVSCRHIKNGKKLRHRTTLEIYENIRDLNLKQKTGFPQCTSVRFSTLPVIMPVSVCFRQGDSSGSMEKEREGSRKYPTD